MPSLLIIFLITVIIMTAIDRKNFWKMVFNLFSLNKTAFKRAWNRSNHKKIVVNILLFPGRLWSGIKAAGRAIRRRLPSLRRGSGRTRRAPGARRTWRIPAPRIPLPASGLKRWIAILIFGILLIIFSSLFIGSAIFIGEQIVHNINITQTVESILQGDIRAQSLPTVEPGYDGYRLIGYYINNDKEESLFLTNIVMHEGQQFSFDYNANGLMFNDGKDIRNLILNDQGHTILRVCLTKARIKDNGLEILYFYDERAVCHNVE